MYMLQRVVLKMHVSSKLGRHNIKCIFIPTQESSHLGSSKGSVEIYLGGALMNTKFLGKKEAIN